MAEFIDKDNITHYDDPSIPDTEGFLRRVPEFYWEHGKISSSIFGPEGISFSLESLITCEEFHDEFPDQGMLKLLASQLRQEDEVLERDPCGPKKSEIAHALSWGNRNNKRKKKRLRDAAQIIYRLIKDDNGNGKVVKEN